MRRAIGKATAVLGLLAATAAAEVSLEPERIALVPGGADLVGGPPAGWSHVAMSAQPKIARGDTTAAPEMVMRYAETFGSVLLANVEGVEVADGPAPGKQYRLKKLGFGHTITTPEGARRLVDSKSPELDFIGGRVLASGEKEVAKLRQVARYETAILFDAPAVMVRNGKHVELVVRNFVWTSARRGGLATAMWTLAAVGDGYRVADEHFVWVPAGFEDERLLSVDPRQFTFGLPGPRAFAMLRLPDGEKRPFTGELARVAAMPRYTEATLQQLAAGLGAAISAPAKGEPTPASP